MSHADLFRLLDLLGVQMVACGARSMAVNVGGRDFRLYTSPSGVVWSEWWPPPAREVGINVAARHAEDCVGYRGIVDQAGPELARQMWLDFPVQSWIANGPAAGRTARGIG